MEMLPMLGRGPSRRKDRRQEIGAARRSARKRFRRPARTQIGDERIDETLPLRVRNRPGRGFRRDDARIALGLSLIHI